MSLLRRRWPEACLLLGAALAAVALIAFAIGRGPGEASYSAKRPETEIAARAIAASENTGRDRSCRWSLYQCRQGYFARGRLIRELRRLLREIARAELGSIHRIIEVGAAAYGQSYPTLLRKAKCESRLWPFARNNGSANSPMGLFQFRPSTWKSTPFGRFSIWDPWAQSLAASWMHAHLRGGEWDCA